MNYYFSVFNGWVWINVQEGHTHTVFIRGGSPMEVRRRIAEDQGVADCEVKKLNLRAM